MAVRPCMASAIRQARRKGWALGPIARKTLSCKMDSSYTSYRKIVPDMQIDVININACYKKLQIKYRINCYKNIV